MANNHIIQKQVLEVEMENPSDAFEFRNRLGEVFQDLILPQLTVLFDELGETKTYRIEAMHIDAGIIARQNWEHLLTEKIIAEVRQAIQLENPIWVREKPKPKNTTLIFEQLPNNVNRESEKHSRNREDEQTLDNDQAKVEFYNVFEEYLRTGNVSWYAHDIPKLRQGFEEYILPEITTVKRLADYLQTASESALLRLIYLLPSPLLNKLLQVLLSGAHPEFIHDFQSLQSTIEQVLLNSTTKELSIKKGLYLPVFKWLAYGQHVQIQSFIAAEVFHYFKDIQPDLLPEVLKQDRDKSNALLNLLRENFKADSNEKRIEKIPEAKQDKEEQPGERFIENAGLIMLHPFLPQLFQEVKLTVDNVFIDEQSRMKAIMLTHFLATGIAEAEDYELSIEKLLCGLQPNEPIVCDIELLDSDIKEANDLLAQIIQLWKQNGVQVNGTIEGFQQSFLQRQGKLNQKRDDWKLQVQQLPYDVVLSSLPWSISMIKTVWMKGMLWIEWA